MDYRIAYNISEYSNTREQYLRLKFINLILCPMQEREIRIFLRPQIIIQALSKVSIKCGIHNARI